jgi:hypothetical protein
MAEMTEFERAVTAECEGLECVAIGCAGPECEHADGDENHQCEPSFSWMDCDSCGSHLGGDRHVAVGLYRDDDGKLQTLSMGVCVDCAMYHANGELPEVYWEA